MDTKHPGPQFTDEELHAIEAEDVANQARARTHRIAKDGVFMPHTDAVDNSDTGRFLRRLEDWRNDIEERRPAAVNVDAELDNLAGLRDRHWLNRILALGTGSLAAVDTSELRVLVAHCTNLEDRLREKSGLFAREITRRIRESVAVPAKDVPKYLKAVP